MTDEYNFDLTEDERPVLSERFSAFGGGLPTDDSGFIRIMDPVTGAGLFTSNTDPNVVGIDPLTGADALTGTDVGFGAVVRRGLSSQVWNGAFEVPPPDRDVPIAADNPIPYWTVVHESGQAFDFIWTEVGNGNGQINVNMKHGAAGDRSYLQQYVPVNSTTGPRWFYEVLPYLVSGDAAKMDTYIVAQFVDDEGATTGTAGTPGTSNEVVYPNSTGQAPGDARWLRVRAGFERDGAAAATDTASGIISEIAVNVDVDQSSSRTWTPTLTFATPGDLNVAYSTRTGRYIKLGRLIVAHCVIVTSTFTHTTASGGLRITGLPFTPATASGHSWYGSCLLRYTKAGYTWVQPRVPSAEAVIVFEASGTGVAVQAIVATDMPTGTQVTANVFVAYEAV